MDLLIDTTSYSVVIGLAKDGKIFAEKKWDAQKNLSEELPTKIKNMIEELGHKLSDLERIKVHSGPGGFTTLRVGVTCANTLGYALNIPVNGFVSEELSLEELAKKQSEDEEKKPVIPVYKHPPLITISNKI